MIFPIKNIIGKKEIIFSGFLILFFSAFAQATTIPINKIEFNNPSSLNSVQMVTDSITNWLLSVTVGIAILFLIIGGIYYITAAGDNKQIEEAKKIINYTVIGLIVILISYSLVTTLNKIIFG